MASRMWMRNACYEDVKMMKLVLIYTIMMMVMVIRISYMKKRGMRRSILHLQGHRQP